MGGMPESSRVALMSQMTGTKSPRSFAQAGSDVAGGRAPAASDLRALGVTDPSTLSAARPAPATAPTAGLGAKPRRASSQGGAGSTVRKTLLGS